jgi:zinc D-Ala-D-Ala carboxypeptidase
MSVQIAVGSLHCRAMKLAAKTITGLAVPGGWRWRDFKASELACKNDGAILIETDSLDRLQAMRTRWARPMVVTSGFRTPEYNRVVSSTGLTGPHTTGRAFDIAVPAQLRYEFIRLAFEMGWTGIGVGKTFVHLDDVPPGTLTIPRPMVWTY